MGTSWSKFNDGVDSESSVIDTDTKDELNSILSRLNSTLGTRENKASSSFAKSTLFQVIKNSFTAIYKATPSRGANALTSGDIADKINSYDKYAPKISPVTIRKHMNDFSQQLSPSFVGRFVRAFTDISKERGLL